MTTKDIDEICSRYLSRREERDKVVECVKRCLKKGYDYHRMKERVGDCVSDSRKADKLIDAFSTAFAEFKKKSKFTETKERAGEKERDMKRKEETSKRKEEREKDRDEPVQKRVKEETEEDIKPVQAYEFNIDEEKAKIRKLAEEAIESKRRQQEEKKNRIVTEEELRQKELRYKAQQDIQAIKARLNLKGPELSAATKNKIAQMNAGKDKANVLDPREASMYINYAMSKQSRMEELKAKLGKSAGLLQKNAVPTAAVNPAIIPMLSKIEPTEEVLTRELDQEQKIVEYLDPRLKMKTAGRSRRGLIFHDKGEFVQIANKQRSKAKLEKLQEEISKAAKHTGISSAVKLAMVTPAGSSCHESPSIEWWDAVVLEADNYDSIADESDPNRYKSAISELIEHPIKLQPPNESQQPQYLKVFLTKRERKKIRRMNRKEAQKELTEKVRLGLEKAPEPKVKLSNLMRVLGSDVVQDPTKMEAHVRKQMADRLKKHHKENAERKLTAEQRSQKKTKKLSEDTSLGVAVSVFRLKSLMHPAKKFKVEMNAKQLQMTGCILLHKDINLVVVEGGPKQQKFYKNLMLNRLKWNEEIIGEKKAVADKGKPGERNECQMIWEGVVKKRAFRDFKVHTVTLQKQARELLEKYGVAHYWDLAYSTTILLEGQSVVDV